MRFIIVLWRTIPLKAGALKVDSRDSLGSFRRVYIDPYKSVTVTVRQTEPTVRVKVKTSEFKSLRTTAMSVLKINIKSIFVP